MKEKLWLQLETWFFSELAPLHRGRRARDRPLMSRSVASFGRLLPLGGARRWCRSVASLLLSRQRASRENNTQLSGHGGTAALFFGSQKKGRRKKWRRTKEKKKKRDGATRGVDDPPRSTYK